ncbi:MAG: type II toxin-antitoxin system RelE family toxin [Victivallaceae bacterium]
MNLIFWTKKAERQLEKIPADYQIKIVIKTRELKKYPACNADVKQLQGQPEKRLRVGRYRVIFNHEAEIKIIRIEEVKKRDDRTY